MTANVLSLLLNGFTLALALGLLTLALWQNSKSTENRYFSLFLFMVVLWTSGALLGRSTAYVGGDVHVVGSGLRLLELGFTGASISIYIYSVVITGVRGRFFRWFALIGLGVVVAYQFLLMFIVDVPPVFEVTSQGELVYRFDTASTILYLTFQSATRALVWRNRLKMRSRSLMVGILMFSGGQILGLIGSRFREMGISEDVSAAATLIITYSVVRQQIMIPLLGRAKQLEGVRDVGLAITSRLHLQETLSTIAAQAVGLLDADAAAIFLKRGSVLELAAVYNMPHQYVGLELALGDGVVGSVAVERRGRRIENYHRDWRGISDLPLAHEAFGAVACVPLMFALEVVGVLLVIQGRQGRLFDSDDMYLLELLGPQAAVAVTNSRLFEAERHLSGDLSAAKNQLEAVLTGTENPVLAVDRKFRIIFANPAAKGLFEADIEPVGQCVADLAERSFLPASMRRMLRDLREQHVHVYEIVTKGRTYLAHVAELGEPRHEGWVAVLNDVTQLKELDRLKSQMIQMASHDLKNPLQAAMSYLELLTEDTEDIFDKDIHEYVKIIELQLNRMYRIINGILDIERVQSGQGLLEECSLEDMLGHVLVDSAGQARDKKIALELKIEARLPSIAGNFQQLTHAFANLVDNAIKFTPIGGRVEVSACAVRRYVEIEVKDTGIGIPHEEHQQIFDRFYRGRQRGTDGVEGSGLGLALVKSVIENHRGVIEVESELEAGTIMRVRLPSIELALVNNERRLE